jgi:hypothetical protein
VGSLPGSDQACGDHLAEVSVMADMQLGNAGGPLALQAATPVSGFALVNGTPNILTWTAPNDGQQHRVTVFSSLFVSSTETGGLVQVTWIGPGAGATHFTQLFGANTASSAASISPSNPTNFTVAAGSTVGIVQSSALTGGTATLWAEIWGS